MSLTRQLFSEEKVTKGSGKGSAKGSSSCFGGAAVTAALLSSKGPMKAEAEDTILGGEDGNVMTGRGAGASRQSKESRDIAFLLK